MKWKPSLFDHEKRTTFPLRGAHQNVRCAECHKLTKIVAAKTVLFYKPTPKDCAACHGPTNPVLQIKAAVAFEACMQPASSHSCEQC